MSYNPFDYSILDNDNTTTSALGASGGGSDVYTGTAVQNFKYPHLFVQVATDQKGTYQIQFSNDGTNWDTTLSYEYDPSVINLPQPIYKSGRYHRIIFTNDSTSAQTYLRLYTYLGVATELTTPINATLGQNFPAILARTTDYRYEVANSKRQGRSTWNKFGYNEDVDTASPEIIAAFGGTFNIMTSADTLDVVSDNANDTSAGTGARTVLITGIDGNFEEISETVTLNGLTAVTTTNSFLGVNRAVVLTSGTSQINEGIITIDDTAGTVGTQASLPANGSVTQQAIFHTPINHNFLADWLFINLRKLSGGSAPRATIRGYSFSRVTNTAYEIFDFDIDASVENSVELKPSQPFVIGGREVLYFTCDTNTNNTSVRLRFSGILERLTLG